MNIQPDFEEFFQLLEEHRVDYMIVGGYAAERREAMQRTRHAPFQRALETVETLSGEQQMDLIDLLKRRLAEERRDEIASNIRQAKRDEEEGKLQRGSVSDLMRSLRS